MWKDVARPYFAVNREGEEHVDCPNITFNRFGKVNVVELLSCMLWYNL